VSRGKTPAEGVWFGVRWGGVIWSQGVYTLLGGLYNILTVLRVYRRLNLTYRPTEHKISIWQSCRTQENSIDLCEKLTTNQGSTLSMQISNKMWPIQPNSIKLTAHPNQLVGPTTLTYRIQLRVYFNCFYGYTKFMDFHNVSVCIRRTETFFIALSKSVKKCHRVDCL